MTMPSSAAIWRRITPTRGEQRAAGAGVDQRHEAEADRELERVERQRVERRVARGGQLGRRRASADRGLGAAAAASCSSGPPLRIAQPIASEERRR